MRQEKIYCKDVSDPWRARQKFAIERRFSCSPFDRNAATMVDGCASGVAKIQYSFDRREPTAYDAL